MQKRPIKAIGRWQFWVATEVFSVAIELFGYMSRQWVLCHGRIWSRHDFSGSRQRLFWSQQCCLYSGFLS